MGPQRQSSYRIPIGPREYGQEPLMDFVFGRRLLQSATGRHGCHPGDAPASASNWESKEHAATNRDDARIDGGHRAGRAGRGLRPSL